MKSFILISSFLILAGALTGCSEQDSNIGTPSTSGLTDQGQMTQNDKSYGNIGLPGRGGTLRLKGVGHGYDGTVPDIDGDGVDDPATCFDVGLYDSAGKMIGTATDCLSDITPVGDGLALVGTTIFNLPNGTFVTRGSTTVQPLTTSGASPATHITGAIAEDGTNGVLYGTGAFEGFKAQVRLSGAVNMSEVDSGIIVFDCLFMVTPQ
jgi:hypothetical protein